MNQREKAAHKLILGKEGYEELYGADALNQEENIARLTPFALCLISVSSALVMAEFWPQPERLSVAAAAILSGTSLLLALVAAAILSLQEKSKDIVWRVTAYVLAFLSTALLISSLHSL